MTIKDYAGVLKWTIQTQINYIEEEERNGTFETEYMEGKYRGMVRGLEIALEKIEASMFLAKEWWKIGADEKSAPFYLLISV